MSESRETPKWNHYTCERCRRVTIAKHEHEGVTPFMVECLASPSCEGSAYSGFYRGPQDDDQQPHLIWFRAQNERELHRVLKTYPRSFREAIREHHDKGGCLMRKVGTDAVV